MERFRGRDFSFIKFRSVHRAQKQSSINRGGGGSLFFCVNCTADTVRFTFKPDCIFGP
jgi:hypothetical protein